MTEVAAYKRNINLIYWLHLIEGFAIGWGVIYILFLLDNGINFFQVSLLMLVFSAVLFLMEVPTGIFTDFHGRKLSLIISYVLISAGAFTFSRGSTFTIFLLAILFFSIGTAFWSGTMSSLIVEDLMKIKAE